MVGSTPLWDLMRQKDVVIPEGVREIGEQQFESSGIEKVTIPGSVEIIGAGAFNDCAQLNAVVFADRKSVV